MRNALREERGLVSAIVHVVKVYLFQPNGMLHATEGGRDKLSSTLRASSSSVLAESEGGKDNTLTARLLGP